MTRRSDEEHLETMEAVLSRLELSGLKLQRKKFHYNYYDVIRGILYLDH